MLQKQYTVLLARWARLNRNTHSSGNKANRTRRNLPDLGFFVESNRLGELWDPDEACRLDGDMWFQRASQEELSSQEWIELQRKMGAPIFLCSSTGYAHVLFYLSSKSDPTGPSSSYPFWRPI